MFYLSYVDLNGIFIGHAFVRERNGKFVWRQGMMIRHFLLMVFVLFFLFFRLKIN